jgi:chromosome segregation ATPase
MSSTPQTQKLIDYKYELSLLETQFEATQHLKIIVQRDLKQTEAQSQTLIPDAIGVNQQLNELEMFSPVSLEDKISTLQKSIKEMEKEIVSIEKYNRNLETEYLKTKGSIFAALLTLNYILSDNSQTERLFRKYREQLEPLRLELAVEELMEKTLQTLFAQSAHMQIAVPRRETLFFLAGNASSTRNRQFETMWLALFFIQDFVFCILQELYFP